MVIDHFPAKEDPRKQHRFVSGLGSQKHDNSTSLSQTKRRNSPAQKKRDKERLKKLRRMKRARSKSRSGTDSMPVDTTVDVQQRADLEVSDFAACKIISKDTLDTMISSRET